MTTTEERDALRIKRVMDLIAHAGLARPGVRVLDLAARTGAFSIALTVAGARVTAIEGRLANVRHWPATYEGKPVEVIIRDVRELGQPLPIDPPEYRARMVSDPPRAQFDVVLCLGILYHLEPDDGRRLIQDMCDRTAPGGIAIIDTHVGGHWQPEPGGPDDPWGAIGNERSWWFDIDELARELLGLDEDAALLSPIVDPDMVMAHPPSIVGRPNPFRYARVDGIAGRAYPDEPASRAWLVAYKAGGQL